MHPVSKLLLKRMYIGRANMSLVSFSTLPLRPSGPEDLLITIPSSFFFTVSKVISKLSSILHVYKW